MSVTRSSDGDLVQTCLAGDTAAFDELVNRYRGAVYSLVLRRTGDREAAEELAQDAFMSAYRSLASLRDGNRFGSWLKGIAVNLCAYWYRRHARRCPETPLADAETLPASPDLADELGTEQVRASVRAAVQGLSRANRLAATLFYFDGLTCREVADFCGVTEGAIKSRLFEARKALREEIEMGFEKRDKEEKGAVPATMVVWGEASLRRLFEPRPEAEALYFALYPHRRRDDEAFWEQWQHVENLNELLATWESAGLVRDEDDALVGMAPVYTEADHELFAAWHARVSAAIVRRVKEKSPAIDALADQFRGDTSDRDNIRRITVVNRALGGMLVQLSDELAGAAHGWGDLGEAYIWGQRGAGLPPVRPFIGFAVGLPPGPQLFGDVASVCYGGKDLVDSLGADEVLPVLADICHARASRDEEQRARTTAVLDGMLAAGWLAAGDGVLSVKLPWLPMTPREDKAQTRDLAERLAQPVVEAAEELKALAAQATFARCRFSDVASMILFQAYAYVVRALEREGVIVAPPLPPLSGIWLYAGPE